MNKKTLILIFLNSVFLASGLILNLVSCISYNNWWPLFTIFVNLLAIAAPTLCGGCATYDDEFYAEAEGQVTLASLSWVILGAFIIVGYAIPIELFRARAVSQTGVLLTLSGGTVILASVLVFVRLIYFTKEEGRFYFV